MPQARSPPDSKLPKTPRTFRNSMKRHQMIDILSQSKICKQWEVEMERLNAKYNLDCFCDSELDLESDEGEQYKYEHGYGNTHLM